MCSNIAFACGFLIMVGLCLIPYKSHGYLKFNLNSLPLLYTKYQHLGYLLNQNLLTNHAMRSELLSKISLVADWFSSSVVMNVAKNPSLVLILQVCRIVMIPRWKNSRWREFLKSVGED